MKSFTRTGVVFALPLLITLLLPACAGNFVARSGSSKAAVGEKKPVVLVVSFGTSYNDTRANTIGAIEKAIAAAYPNYEQRQAFTSQIIIDKLRKRDGLQIDNITEAMNRLKADGVKELVVQPTHVMNGLEYDEMQEAIKPFSKDFTKLSYGLPLLISDSDYTEVVNIITNDTKQYAADDTAVVFMGHGTEHEANATYSKLDTLLKAKGFSRYIIGTVEATPSLDDVIAQVDALNVKKVVLFPFMIVAGDHANNDMAGDEEDSWKTILESKGYTVRAVLRGLGEYPGIQAMFVRHAGDAIGNS
ncbi:sirohydrochlorin cobaltochelatase [Treponema primitia ZAS-2]|uniref:Sirohydrochlorin cobaltochelatase n=1 Tax=Treponema primitia (strain ATCC BAA-887 / DSM 12427 / ZAS-2) TaxID=545694 RepID=F5YLC4_TREPZ|nr:sirohydrochlorin cobaltochelatase [Treponema primitia]AEF86213.1 sirohydrochlorin cobaltochelatase [Treponema primitia ZAS-2]